MDNSEVMHSSDEDAQMADQADELVSHSAQKPWTMSSKIYSVALAIPGTSAMLTHLSVGR